MRDTILKANAVYDKGPVKAHDVRGLATSIAFKSNISIANILEAATWKSSSTFAEFYFKDIAFSSKGWKALGPFVAAGSVVNSSS